MALSFSKMLAPMRLAPERTFRIALNLPTLGDKAPAVIVRYAGEGNDGFMNAQFKAARAMGFGDPSAARTRLDRELSAPIFAEHVLVGWEGIYNDEVQPVEFTADAAKEFLLALAREVPSEFERVRGMSRMIENFRDPIAAADDLGKG